MPPPVCLRHPGSRAPHHAHRYQPLPPWIRAAGRQRRLCGWVSAPYLGGSEVDRWLQDDWSLRVFVHAWLCTFTVGGRSLRGTGGRGRCWGPEAAHCCSLRGWEWAWSRGGGGGGGGRQWWNLEDFVREQLLCAEEGGGGVARRNLLAAQDGKASVIFSAVRCKRGEQSHHRLALQHPRCTLAKINRGVFAQRDHVSDTRVLVSLRQSMQTWTSVSEMNTTVSQARSVSTHWVPLPVSVRMATARLERSASVRVHPSTAVAQ